jgi:hypothetical protein
MGLLNFQTPFIHSLQLYHRFFFVCFSGRTPQKTPFLFCLGPVEWKIKMRKCLFGTTNKDQVQIVFLNSFFTKIFIQYLIQEKQLLRMAVLFVFTNQTAFIYFDKLENKFYVHILSL